MSIIIDRVNLGYNQEYLRLPDNLELGNYAFFSQFLQPSRE